MKVIRRKLVSSVKTYLIILFFAWAGMACGQKASAKLDPKSILIGDQVILNLSFTGPAGTEVAWPSLKDTIIGNIQVISRASIDSTWTADKKNLTMSQNLRLTCFDSGFYTLPSIRFYYRKLPDTTIRYAETDIQILTVHTMAVDTTLAIKPIKGPIHLSFSIMDYIGWIVAGIIFLALVGFLVYYMIQKRKGEPLFVLRPAVKYLPHELALMELEKLKNKKLWQSGRTKEYHTELTDILRKYIEDRFQVMALESTTGEILNDLASGSTIAKGQRESLSRILSSADLVKFAKFVPLPQDHDNIMSESLAFINETYALPAPLVPEAGSDGTAVTDTKQHTTKESREEVTNNPK